MPDNCAENAVLNDATSGGDGSSNSRLTREDPSVAASPTDKTDGSLPYSESSTASTAVRSKQRSGHRYDNNVNVTAGNTKCKH